MMIEMYHHDKYILQGQERDCSDVIIRLGTVNQDGSPAEGGSIIRMSKNTMSIGVESSISMGILNENGLIDSSYIEINRNSNVGTSITSAHIKADYIYINGNVQVNGTPINT